MLIEYGCHYIGPILENNQLSKSSLYAGTGNGFGDKKKHKDEDSTSGNGTLPVNHAAAAPLAEMVLLLTGYGRR